MNYQQGFSLVELIVVLTLFVILLSLAPQGLDRLYNKSRFDAQVQDILSSIDDCAVLALQENRTLNLRINSNEDSNIEDCAIAVDRQVEISFNDRSPIFYGDGTSNGATIRLQEGKGEKNSSILISQLNSRAKLIEHAQE